MENNNTLENQSNSQTKFNLKSSSPYFTIISSTTRKTYRGSEHPSKRWGHSVILYNKSMIIFGGHHLQRSLSNIYAFDFTTLTWSKIEPFGNPPPARDSHSAIIYNNIDMIIFGGNGSTGKLNDLWNFNLNEKKWTKINAEGTAPSVRDGHLSSLLYNKYMVIFAGLNDKDEFAKDIFLLDIENKKWLECEIEGTIILNRDGQSCGLVGDSLYLFGGQGPGDDEYNNDLYILKVTIDETLKIKPRANISKVEINNKIKPKERASHCCVVYKDQYLIISGGEGKKKEPLNDFWIFDLKTKCYTEVELQGNEKIEGRFCHTCMIYGDYLVLYGGMKNSDVTLDNLTILNLQLNQNKKLNNKDYNKNYEIVNNNKKKKLNENITINNKIIEEENMNNEIIIQSRKDMEDFSTDTNDLLNMDLFSFEEIKKNYLNNLMTWNFLKSLSDFYKWPIGCLGNFLKNSLKDYVNTKNIYIDIKKFKNDEIYLSIKDDGKGISCSDFNGIMFSFIKNQNKDLNYFQYGFSMKATAMRLADSFLIISKTSKEVSIGMISKELQKKLKNIDYILTPIVNYRIEKKIETNKMKYIPKSNFPFESINLILDIASFLFKDIDKLIDYFNSFETGTHIYLFNLKTNDKNETGYLKNNTQICTNYELIFDEKGNDIYLNEDYEFDEYIKKNIIDFSFKKYLSFMLLKHSRGVNIYLFGKKNNFENPYYNIKLMSSPGNNMKTITNLNYNNINQQQEKIDCFNIEGSDYTGILFNENFIDSITSNTNLGIEDIQEKDYLNGILLYKDNLLISRLNQSFFGDTNFFINKMMNIYKNNYNNDINNIIPKDEDNNYLCKNIFKKNGYIELPSNGYELMFNNMEIKDQALFGYIYNKIKVLVKNIQK